MTKTVSHFNKIDYFTMLMTLTGSKIKVDKVWKVRKKNIELRVFAGLLILMGLFIITVIA